MLNSEFITNDELQVIISGLEDKFLTKVTFQSILDLVADNLYDKMSSKTAAANKTIELELARTITRLQEVSNRMDRRSQKNDELTREISSLQVLLGQIKQELKHSSRDYEEIHTKTVEHDEDIQQLKDRFGMVEGRINALEKGTFGTSTKGQQLTIIERLAEVEITSRDQDGRISTLEKVSPKNYQLVEEVQRHYEVFKSYNILMLLLSDIYVSSKRNFILFLKFLNKRKKKLITTFLQSFILKVIVFLVGLFASSPLWGKVIEEILEILLK